MDKRQQAHQVRPDQLTSQEVALWNRLQSEHPALATPFLSYPFVLAALRAGADVWVCVIRSNDTPIAFLPFQFSHPALSALRAAEPVGAHLADYFGLIAAPELTITPDRLLQLAGLNQLTFTHLDESQLQHGLTGEAPRTGLRIPCMSGNSTAEPDSGMVSHKLRADLKRRAKLLTDTVGPLRFEFNQTDQRSLVLDELIRHKRAQYASTGVPDALGTAWSTRLLQQLLSTANPACAGILSVLRAGEHWVASHFGIQGNGILQYWFPVYNPDMTRYSPGKLLLEQIWNSCPQHQIHTIDRGEGATQSKLEIHSVSHRYFRGRWNNHSASSLLVRGAQSLKWRMEKQDHEH